MILTPMGGEMAWGRMLRSMEAYPGTLLRGCLRGPKASALAGAGREQLDSKRGRVGLVGLVVGLDYGTGVGHMPGSTHDALRMWAGFVLLLGGVRGVVHSIYVQVM